MADNVDQQLVRYLSEAHAMEKQALLLLSRGAEIVGDEEVARVFRAHELQTQEHARYVAERLEAHGESPSKVKDLALPRGCWAHPNSLPTHPQTLLSWHPARVTMIEATDA